MNVTVSNHHLLQGEEEQKTKKEIMQSAHFKALSSLVDPEKLTELQYVGGFSLNLQQENTSVKTLSNEFSTPDNKVRFIFTKSNKASEERNTATALIVTSTDGTEVLETSQIVDDGKVKLLSILSLTGTIRDKFHNGIESSKIRFDELRKQNNDVSTQALWDGCMPGGYFWCGGGCGYQTGSSDIKNRIDGCCLNHDYCYKNDIDSTCGCDEDLYDCVTNPITRADDPTTADYIADFFLWKCVPASSRW